ncbi:MAG TPA: TadE/TadG family type IV pilus assembly protein [Candidatus Cybelea sp.]|nr:TadE/TadG family type IV pilus assembly protein [Candidatus Cybelea sp.]
MRKLLRSQAGAAMVEFAVALPFLVLLMIGVIEVGRYMYFGILAAHAAEAGAEYGSQTLTTAADTAGIKSAASADSAGLSSFLASPQPLCLQSTGTENGTTTVACPTGTPPAGTIEYVQVTVTGTFHSLLNYPGMANSLPVTASTTMRVLNQ